MYDVKDQFLKDLCDIGEFVFGRMLSEKRKSCVSD